MSWYGEVGTGSCTYWYVLVCTGTYQYVLLCTDVFHPYLQCYSVSDGLWCVQDTIIVVPPYPYSITEEIDDVPFEDRWYARPQLLFQCQHLAVELWSWKATPGWSNYGGDDSAEGNCEEGPSQAFC